MPNDFVNKRREDPAFKMLRSGFGVQPKSTQSTEPAVSFGSGGRDAFNKVYLSPEHAKAMVASNSQGPVYKLYSCMGPQVSSSVPTAGSIGFGTGARLPKPGKNAAPGPGAYEQPPALGDQAVAKRASAPRAVFGTGTRDGRAKVYMDSELMKSCAGNDAPPPGSYNIPAAVGPQVDSTKVSAPGIKIGTGLRALDYQVRAAKNLPGPGGYNQYCALGKQSLSNKKTLPAVGFSKGTRDGALKAFISKEHEKSGYGQWTPGPATAGPYNSYGKQVLSNKRTSAGCSFGSGKRLPEGMNDAPGPGTYYA